MLKLRQLQRMARETGFEAGALEKVLRLLELLEVIGADDMLAPVLALKGGTAFNLCFGPPTRLSVDIDFNYIGAEDRTEMLAARPHVENVLMAKLRELGYRVQPSRVEHAGRKFHAGYSRYDGQLDQVQVDVGYLSRVSLFPVETRTAWSPADDAGPQVTVISRQELAAGKVLALLDRCAARDAWDVARLPLLWNDVAIPAVFKRLFVGLSGVLDHALYRYGPKRLDRLTDATVEAQLWPMITSGDRPKAADLRAATWAVVGPLVDLEPSEREYIDSVQSGELRPELLFPDDPALADRLRRYPPLQWKAENARAHARATTKRRRAD